MAHEAEPALVVVLNDPADLRRARDEGWYRIPLNRAPPRIGAEYLAFYQTGAFPPGERWAVRWYAPVRAYRILPRYELIPGEPDHPRAHDLYYRIALGALAALPHPIPSRRLRRITFIPTTLPRLLEAEEINDLWIKSSAQEQLWAALKAAGVAVERQYPLNPDLPDVVDFALPDGDPPTALIVTDEPRDELSVRERASPAYLPAGGVWTVLQATCEELTHDPAAWARRFG